MATLTFSCEIDERVEWEIGQKGYFEHATVRLPEGTNVPVCFWDPVRLSQDLKTDLQQGRKCLAQPGMIILPKVTVDNMRAAVEELYQRGYFKHLKEVVN
jgi:hypothetical protein